MALVATGWLGCVSPSGPEGTVDTIVAVPDAAPSDHHGPAAPEGDPDAALLDGALPAERSLPEASLADVTSVSQADALGDAAITDIDHEGGVGSRVYEAWANWPMPNGPGTGLPNPQQYDLSTPGVVHDLVTGLFWEREGYQDELAWADADQYCRHLRVGAFRDFRLPSRIELVSLYDTGATGRSLFPSVLPMPPFPANLDFEVALSTLSPDGNLFWEAKTGLEMVSADTAKVQDNVLFTFRCVRSEPIDDVRPPDRYEVGASTVRDRMTKLTWQRGSSPFPLPWADAVTYCQGLSLGGTRGFRLPSQNELQTLVDETKSPVGSPGPGPDVGPTLDTGSFTGTAAGLYWSSWEADADYRGVVDFRTGFAQMHSMTQLTWPLGSPDDKVARARCVQ